MKPFVLLATRSEDVAADAEYACFLRHCGLRAEQLWRIRLEAGPMPRLDLAEISGILLGGSPFNNSDAPASKSATQVRVEREIAALLDRVVPADFPVMGACYGIGAIGTHQGARVDATYAEPVGAVRVSLTPEGRRDPVFSVLPPAFEAFVGHKESIAALPSQAAALASSSTCPVQAFRVGRSVYATQFHPELDAAALGRRMDAYRHHGYFEPADAEAIKTTARAADVGPVHRLLSRFVEVFARE